MNTSTTDQWETYCDECYYHMWRLRRKTERGWHDGFHVHTGEEAKGLCDLLNKLERERDEARALATQYSGEREHNAMQALAYKAERDEAREALKTGGMLNIIDRAAHGRAAAIRERDEARGQRDRLAAVLNSIRDGYGGQVADPDCDCGECEFLISIDNALQSLTQNSHE